MDLLWKPLNLASAGALRAQIPTLGGGAYRGTSLIRNTPLLVGLYLGSYGGPWGGGLFLMSEVHLYMCRARAPVPFLVGRMLQNTFCPLYLFSQCPI